MSLFGNETPAMAWFRLRQSDGTVGLCVCVHEMAYKVPLPQAGSFDGIAFARGHCGLEALAGWLSSPDLLCQVAGNLQEWCELGPFAAVNNRTLPALVHPGKIVALGRTFPAHAKEMGNVPVKEPLVFLKLSENIVGAGDALVIPSPTGERFDNEIELGALINADLHDVDPKRAQEAIAGWIMLNDFTWRSEQGRAKASGAPWHLAKNLPRCFPLGSFFLPMPIMPDPRSLGFCCRINGQIVQEGNFEGMGQSPSELIAWLSSKVPLRAGDFVALGTPKGVTTVSPGDLVETSIESLGSMSHKVTSEGAQ